MNRWLRLGLQTAFGLVLLSLWLRTVSLPEVLSHARVHSWWPTGERAFAWARRFDWERHIDVLEREVLHVARTQEQVSALAATA